MEDHGTVFGTRAKLVRERVEAMKRYRDADIARVTPSLPAAREDVVLPILDRVGCAHPADGRVRHKTG